MRLMVIDCCGRFSVVSLVVIGVFVRFVVCVFVMRISNVVLL